MCSRQVFAVMKNAFNENGGKQGVRPYPKTGLPGFAEVEAWDGKEAKVEGVVGEGDDLLAQLLAEQQEKEANEKEAEAMSAEDDDL